MKKTFNITFHFKPVLKIEELASLLKWNKWKLFWAKHEKIIHLCIKYVFYSYKK